MSEFHEINTGPDVNKKNTIYIRCSYVNYIVLSTVIHTCQGFPKTQAERRGQDAA